MRAASGYIELYWRIDRLRHCKAPGGDDGAGINIGLGEMQRSEIRVLRVVTVSRSNGIGKSSGHWPENQKVSGLEPKCLKGGVAFSYLGILVSACWPWPLRYRGVKSVDAPFSYL